MMLSAEQAQGLATFLIQGVEQEIPTTKKVLAAFPNDKLGFTLGEKGRTAKDLMWHTIEADIWFTEGISAGAFPQTEGKDPAPATVAEMTAKYESGMAAGMAKSGLRPFAAVYSTFTQRAFDQIWQEVVLKFAGVQDQDRWGGPADGVWRGIAKGYALNITNGSFNGGAKKGELWIDDAEGVLGDQSSDR